LTLQRYSISINGNGATSAMYPVIHARSPRSPACDHVSQPPWCWQVDPVFQSLKALRARSAALTERRAPLKAALTDTLQLDDQDSLQVTEITCPDPDGADCIPIVLGTRVEQALEQITAENCLRIIAEDSEKRANALP
jgi:hypothetical protein